MKFKVGDRVCAWGSYGTIVEWTHRVPQEHFNAVVFDTYEYTSMHPHNWIMEKELRHLTPLEQALM